MFPVIGVLLCIVYFFALRISAITDPHRSYAKRKTVVATMGVVFSLLFVIGIAGASRSVLLGQYTADFTRLSAYRDEDGHRVPLGRIHSLQEIRYYRLGEDGFVHPIVEDEDRVSKVLYYSEDLGGSPVTSDDFRGRDFIVYFRWADWCEDCDSLLQDIESCVSSGKSGTLMFVGVPYISGGETTVDTVSSKLSEYPNLIGSPSFSTLVWTPDLAASVFGVSLEEIPYLCITTGEGTVVWRGTYSDFLYTLSSPLFGVKEENPFGALSSELALNCGDC